MDEQIIEQMAEAALKRWLEVTHCTSVPWANIDERTQNNWRDAVEATIPPIEQHLKAKHAEEVLAEPSKDEWYEATIPPADFRVSDDGKRFADCASITRMLKDRKRRFLAPEAKVRVTITRIDACSHVYLDGRWQQSFSQSRDAERYAAGLRAELEGK